MKVESSINKQLNLPDLNELGSLVVHNELLPSGKYLLKFIPAIRHSGIVPFERLPLNLKHNLYIKRVGDIIVSMLIILCVLSWLIPLLALIIKLDSKGPVFFFQKRNNRNGKVFTCIKFRSMIVNDEAHLMQAEENDRRITRFGKYLRKNHIDELPQFFNVFWGEMSLVGPRPHMIRENLRYDGSVEFYALRLRVKPGITGLAQVMGYAGTVREIEDMETRVRLDNYYIRHWSLKMDVMIFLTTLIRTT